MYLYIHTSYTYNLVQYKLVYTYIYHHTHTHIYIYIYQGCSKQPMYRGKCRKYRGNMIHVASKSCYNLLLMGWNNRKKGL